MTSNTPESKTHEPGSDCGLTNTQSNDLQWLAYELHDGLLQWLIGAKLDLEHTQGLSTLDSHAQEYLDRAIEEGRELIGLLEEQSRQHDSSSTQELELSEALTRFIHTIRPTWEANGQELYFIPAVPAWPKLPIDVRWNVLRIAEQAARNAVQHAGPCEIKVHCTWNGRRPRLVISDEGRGFDLSAQPAAGHFGSSSMRHRAQLIGAEFQIAAEPGAGCRVEVSLPEPRN